MKAKKWIVGGSLALVLSLAMAGCNMTGNSSGTAGGNDNSVGGASSSTSIPTGDEHTHQFGQWEVVKAATCAEKGEEKRSCTCGEAETRAIEKTAHSFGQWTTTKNATCTEKGEEKRTCVCGASESRNTVALDHDYGQWTITVEPLVTAEGKAERICSRDANHVEIQNILKTPAISYDTGMIKWEPVEKAVSYDLYLEGALISSLGNVQYAVASVAGDYSIVARTNVDGYREESERSNVITIGYGENSLTAGNVQSVANISDIWRFNIANFSGKSVKMMEKDGMTVLCLSPNSAATIAVGGASIQPNMTIAVEFDVKVENATGTKMNIGLFYDNAWRLPPVDVQIPAADENGWAHICYEYTYDATVPTDAAWGNFDVRYVCEETQNSSAYVANFQIMRVNDNQKVQIDTADFCNTKLNAATDMWYLEFLKYGNYAENEIVFEGENAMLKLTDSDTPDSSFIMASSNAFGQAGTYKVSMKVKLGADANNIGNIGFEIQSDGTPNGQLVDFNRNGNGSWDLKQDEWTTIEAYVNIAEKECTWINLRFYFFTNNDMHPSADNYILVDDISVQFQQGSDKT